MQKSVRQHAEYLLRHYPSYEDIELAHKALPEYLGPVPPFQRLQAKTAITELGLDKLNERDGNLGIQSFPPSNRLALAARGGLPSYR